MGNISLSIKTEYIGILSGVSRVDGALEQRILVHRPPPKGIKCYMLNVMLRLTSLYDLGASMAPFENHSATILGIL